MQKKGTLVLVIIIILAVIIGGGYAIFHKSKKTTNNSSSTSSTTSQTQTTPVNNSVVITKTNSSVGQYLAEPNGEALYTYTGDRPNVSNCTGSCLGSWPVYQDTGSTSNLPTNIGTIKRTDNGETQYTYKDKPLYTFTDDQSGQVNGNGITGFSVARP